MADDETLIEQQQDDGTLVVTGVGDRVVERASLLDRQLGSLNVAGARSVRLDLGGLASLDTASCARMVPQTCSSMGAGPSSRRRPTHDAGRTEACNVCGPGGAALCRMRQHDSGGEAPSEIYALTAPEGVADDVPAVDWQLVVDEPGAAAGLNTSRIAVRPEPISIRYYADAQWAEPAPAMVRSLIIMMFQRSGRIEGVGESSVALNPDYRLSSELIDFEAVYPDDAGGPMRGSACARPSSSSPARRSSARAPSRPPCAPPASRSRT